MANRLLAGVRKSQRLILQLLVVATPCFCVVGLICCQNCSERERLSPKRKQLRLLVEIHIQHIFSATLSRNRVSQSVRKYCPCGNTAGSSHCWVCISSVQDKVLQFALSEIHWIGWDQRLKETVFNKNSIRWSYVHCSFYSHPKLRLTDFMVFICCIPVSHPNISRVTLYPSMFSVQHDSSWSIMSFQRGTFL